MLVLSACAPEAFEPVDMGTVSSDGESGEAWYAAAWGYDQERDGGGRDLLLIVAPRASTCDEAAAWVSDIVDGDDYDPTGVVDPGTCATSFTATAYDPAGTSVASTAEDPAFELLTSVYCAMEGGEWAEGDDGWTYTGDIWSGSARAVTASVSGGDGADYAWSLDADGWSGGFPYDSARLTTDAEGVVAGEGSAGWCEALADAPVFGS